MATAAEPLRLPWTGEFTPGQLGSDALSETLGIVAAHDGDRPAIVEAIRQEWFTEAAKSRSDPAERLKQQQTRSGNVLNGMQNYGLVDDTYRLTNLGKHLRSEKDDIRRSAAFVTFLLKHRKGLELLDAVRTIQNRGEAITKKTLSDELRRRSFKLTVNDTNAGKLGQWLGTAGVIDGSWNIDETRLSELTGVTLATVGEWQSLTKPQRAFLSTLRRIADARGKGTVTSVELIDFVRTEHGPIFDEGQVKKIYQRLEGDGWITHDVKKAGRGGKGGHLTPTQKLIDTDFGVLTGFQPGDLPADLRAKLDTPLDDIYRDLDSSDTHTKGIALELLALNLASDLGLVPVRLRIRGVRTGGAEVDLVSEGAHLQFSRWIFQCKNTKAVEVGVLAKEVGMATLLQCHIIVIATTGRFTNVVQAYAARVTQTTQFQVVLVDGAVLRDYRKGGAMALREQFRREASLTMQLKRPQVIETLEELGEDES